MASDQEEIRELIESWAIWRDSLDWERFRTVWHPEGRMMATWWQGPYEEFIRANQEGFERGVRILHFLGGSSIDLAGDRAVAQTKMTISQRPRWMACSATWSAPAASTTSWKSREGRWGLVLRQPIYEKDRIDPVDPAAALSLDAELLERFPEGYRHLAYLQTRIGYDVKRDMPGLVGPEVERLYARGASWLDGGTLD